MGVAGIPAGVSTGMTLTFSKLVVSACLPRLNMELTSDSSECKARARTRRDLCEVDIHDMLQKAQELCEVGCATAEV